MTSRYGSLTLAALADGAAGVDVSGGGDDSAAAAEPVVTPSPLAGFASGGSVVTPLAGFGGAFFPQAPGGRKPMPAAFK